MIVMKETDDRFRVTVTLPGVLGVDYGDDVDGNPNPGNKDETFVVLRDPGETDAQLKARIAEKEVALNAARAERETAPVEKIAGTRVSALETN